MNEILELAVRLHGHKVGNLRYESESVVFRFDETYQSDPDRRVLGQFFEDDLKREHRVRAGVPPWFANLLPEGPLRELIARTAGVHPSRDFFLLRHLGADLPGAVEVSGEFELTELGDLFEGESVGTPTAAEFGEYEFKFSLAGVQLKFSVLSGERGVTLPLQGQHGDFIAKLPDLRHDGVPENEFSMMTWARAAGIDVPEFSLVPVQAIEGLPPELSDQSGEAFVIRRFDRTGSGRVHIEDFAQVLNRYPTPSGKYGGANYETVGRILLSLGGEEDVNEFVRRLVAIVAMGNGDAHLKNWSLVYADGRRARLAPAYDLVSTVTYVSGEESLALNLARSKDFNRVDLASFRRFARKLELSSEDALDESVRMTVERLQEAWPNIKADLPLRAPVVRAIDERLRELPLLRGRAA